MQNNNSMYIYIGTFVIADKSFLFYGKLPKEVYRYEK